MIEFKKVSEFRKGILLSLLTDAYSFDSNIQKSDFDDWKEFDNFFFDNLEIADKYGFITILDNKPIGFISWDPRNRPEYVEIGYNCILTEYKGNGYGKKQMKEAIRRIKEYNNLKKIIVITDDVLISAQKNYESVGFMLKKHLNKPKSNESYLNGKILYEIDIKK